VWGFIARSLIALVVGMAVPMAIGARTEELYGVGLGVEAGLACAGGLAWAVAFSRIRRGPFALPPLLSVLGVAVAALALMAVARPSTLYLPQWIADQRVNDSDDAPALRHDRFLGDETTPEGAAIMAALPRYRRALTDLTGADRSDFLCSVDVVYPSRDRSDASHHYADLARAAGYDPAIATMGFAYAPPLGRRVVVHAKGSGWGSITHHLALHHAQCTMPGAPTWLTNGIAALVEKHTLDDADRFVLRYRSDWRIPESVLRSEVRDLNIELFRGDDQGFLRAFFLYLHERNMVRPLLARVRAGEDAVAALAAVTGKGPKALEADWRAWLETEAHAIPVLEAATPHVSAPPI
jgi:hypothetical protein